MLFHLFLAYTASDEESSNSNDCFTINNVLFSSDFQEFFLRGRSLVWLWCVRSWSSLGLPCLGSLNFLNPYVYVFNQLYEVFSHCYFKYIYFYEPHCFSFPSRTLVTEMLIISVLSHRSLRFIRSVFFVTQTNHSYWPIFKLTHILLSSIWQFIPSSVFMFVIVLFSPKSSTSGYFLYLLFFWNFLYFHLFHVV